MYDEANSLESGSGSGSGSGGRYDYVDGYTNGAYEEVDLADPNDVGAV